MQLFQQSTEQPGSIFLEMVSGKFFHQLVLEPSHSRPGQAADILDLVFFTNDENMLLNLSFASALGKSQHVIVCFNIVCEIIKASSNVINYQYSKEHYQGIRKYLKEIDWKQ